MSQTTMPQSGTSMTDQVRDAAARAADSSKEMRERAAEAIEGAADNARTLRAYAENNPLIAVGVAFAAGALLSTLVRR